MDNHDTPTRELAAFASRLRIEDLPASTIAHAKRCILDALGCGIYGSRLEWTRLLTETLQSASGTGDAVLWGTGDTLAADAAALINGTAVHSFEMDDLHKTAIMHPGGVTLPALLAMADSQPAVSGAELITALVAGYEVGIHVGLACGVGLLHRGWHNNGVLGAFSAGASAGRLLRLDPDRMEHAIGIAATQAGGLMAAQYGSMVKRFHAGRAAQSGLYSAALAQHGFTGIKDVLGDVYGNFLRTFSDEYEEAKLTEGLGSEFEIENVGFKWYPACGSSHTSIDAVLALRRAHGVTPADVIKCIVVASTATKDHVGWDYVPDTVTTAQMNLPYAIAAALTDGEVTIDQFRPERLTDPDLIELTRRVQVVADPQTDARGPKFRHAVRLQLQLRDGSVVEEVVEHAKGSEYFPLSDEEILSKFRRLTVDALGEEGSERVRDAVEHLEEADDARSLSTALAGSQIGAHA